MYDKIIIISTLTVFQLCQFYITKAIAKTEIKSAMKFLRRVSSVMRLGNGFIAAWPRAEVALTDFARAGVLYRTFIEYSSPQHIRHLYSK